MGSERDRVLGEWARRGGTLALLAVLACAGCADGGGGSSCGPAYGTCNSAKYIGELYGDDPNDAPLDWSSAGSMFISAEIKEVSWDERSISVRGTLRNLGSATYDLLLYVDPNNEALGCGLAPLHAVNSVVDANWADQYDGSSQNRMVVFEIRHRSGPCDGQWKLTIEGNTTSVTAN